MPSFRLAVSYSIAQKYIAFAVNLAVSIILARLLTPAETGIYSLAAATVAIGHLLREFGMSDYIISHQRVTPERLRAAFTVTLLLAWSIAVLIWVAAWPMARFYQEPGVRHTMQLLCINFILLPFGSMAFALLSKELQFGRIFGIQTGATLLGAVVTVACALAGMSYMSLAVGAVVSSVSTTMMLLLLQPHRVFLRPVWTGWREAIGFGGRVTLSRLLEQIASRSSDFIVSAMLGFHAAGLFSKASSLVGSFHEFFNSAVVRVALPAFAAAGADLDQVRCRYLQTTQMVATAQWLFFPVLGVFAHEIVLTLFGPNWVECVPVIQVAAVFSVLWAPFMLSTALLTARRAVSQQLNVQLIATPVTIAALYFGARYNILVVTIALNAALLLRLVLLDAALRRECGMGVEQVVRPLGSSALAGLATVAAGLSLRWAMHDWAVLPIVKLAVGVPGMLVAATVVLWRSHHPLMGEMGRLARQAMNRRGNASA